MTGQFSKVAWKVIKPDTINAFNAFLSLDSRSLHLANDALMVLLREYLAPADLKEVPAYKSYAKFQQVNLQRARNAPGTKDARHCSAESVYKRKKNSR
jgi:hypothetical protein